MKIVKMLKPEYIIEALQSDKKRDVLLELSAPFLKNYPELDPDVTLSILMEREKLGSTGIGEGIAIPHGKLAGLDNLIVCFGRSAAGIDFNAMDGNPVHLFFLLLAPENSAGQHLKALAKISKMLKDSRFRAKLMEAKSSDEIFGMISQQDDII
ncbi:MAG: PTS fructose transporter subunit IIA [Deltaproteobacteria bacterium HGW-Deltaproteobacteria-9]|nr:MAG: PTS fructose transporter subunit IIA [Deltaproteobacteria bacterium HGW-Deltaproteobacteria-9]